MSSSASNQQGSPQRRSRPRRTPAILAFLLACLLVLLFARPALTHFRAVGLLLRIEDPQRAGSLGRIHTYPIEESSTELPSPVGPIRARLYIPQGIANPPGMVIVHGVHHLGIEEPRLVAFARAISASGIRVLTPELPALADYQVTPVSIARIGCSAISFSESLHQKVGVLGISFSGGLSLLAAADPHFAPYIRFVLTLGAHDDLARVAQFFVTNQILRPDGTTLQMQAHEYGPLILIYSHVDEFFPPADVGTAHDALQLLLWENVDASRKVAEMLSPASRKKMDLLYNNNVDALASEIQQSIARHRADMMRVSPHGHLQLLHVPVLLVHGAADNIIPPSEIEWLERDVPHADLEGALVTPLLSHVSMDGKPSFLDNLRLVHFMAQMLALDDDIRPSPPRPGT